MASDQLESIVVPTPADFDLALGDALAGRWGKAGNAEVELFVLFSGALAPPGHPLHGKGVSWCEDCTIAEPILDRQLERLAKELGTAKSVVVLRCPVEREEYKGVPDYPYRKHPKIRLATVPTLVHWGKRGPKERLEEQECQDETLVSDLVDQIVEEQD